MTLHRVRPGNLYRAHGLILQRNFGCRRPLSSPLSTWPWKKVPTRSTPGTSKVPDHSQGVDIQEKNNRLQTGASAEIGANGETNSTIEALLSERSVPSTIASSSSSTEPSISVPEEGHESTLAHKQADITNSDGSGDVIDPPQPVPILKYETTEDESFHEEVHIRPFNSYPAYWLRDNCQCASCIRPDTRQRMVSSFSIPRKIFAKSVQLNKERQVTVEWSDGHVGNYPIDWLKSHQLASEIEMSSKVLTFRNFSHSLKKIYHPWVDYEEVMHTDEGLTRWLQSVVAAGYCLVKGVPVTPEATKKLLERIAFIRETHYGAFWDFTSDLTFKDSAYTAEALDAHTDNTYFTDPARLQLFHLLEHTEGEGGETLLVDGFFAARCMLWENPQNIEALTDHAHPWHSSGNENVSIQPYTYFPVLERDPVNARLLRIRWNNYDRAAKVDWTPHMAMSWYRAARHWDAIIQRSHIQKWLQLEPGTALLFDNWRMLHGRSAFTGKRRMCGGYINNDDFLSRFRLLKNGREKVLNDIGTYTTRQSL